MWNGVASLLRLLSTKNCHRNRGMIPRIFHAKDEPAAKCLEVNKLVKFRDAELMSVLWPEGPGELGRPAAGE